MPAVLDLPVLAAHELLTSVVSALTPALGGGATVVAIVGFTVAVRLLLLPLRLSVARAAHARAALGPELAAVRKKYSHDPVRAQRESTKLLRTHGISPYAGLLPGLAQAPFLWLTYRLFTAPALAGHANLLLTHTVFGIPLAGRLVAAGGLAPAGVLGPYVLVYAVLFLLLLGVAWWSGRIAERSVDAETPPVLRRAGRLVPYATVLAAAFVPLAAAGYLLVSSAWTATERAVLDPRPGRLRPA